MFSYSQQHLEYPWVCQESAGNHWQLVWCEAVAQLPGSLLHVSTVPVSRIWPGCCSPCLKLNSSVSGDSWEYQVSSRFSSLLRFILRRNWYHFEIFFKNDSLSTVSDEVLWYSNGLTLNSLKRTIQSMDAMGKQGKKGKQKTSRHQPFVIIWCCCWVERCWLQTKIYVERLGISQAITPGFAIISPTDKVHVLFTASTIMFFLNYQKISIILTQEYVISWYFHWTGDTWSCWYIVCVSE